MWLAPFPSRMRRLSKPVKLLALSLLNEKYGITEKDFFRAEIEMVPAVKARDVGFDTSMIGAYGRMTGFARIRPLQLR